MSLDCVDSHDWKTLQFYKRLVPRISFAQSYAYIFEFFFQQAVLKYQTGSTRLFLKNVFAFPRWRKIKKVIRAQNLWRVFCEYLFVFRGTLRFILYDVLWQKRCLIWVTQILYSTKNSCRANKNIFLLEQLNMT